MLYILLFVILCFWCYTTIHAIVSFFQKEAPGIFLFNCYLNNIVEVLMILDRILLFSTTKSDETVDFFDTVNNALKKNYFG